MITLPLHNEGRSSGSGGHVQCVCCVFVHGWLIKVQEPYTQKRKLLKPLTRRHVQAGAPGAPGAHGQGYGYYYR